MKRAGHTHRFECPLETPAGVLRTVFECECDCADATSSTPQEGETVERRYELAGVLVELHVTAITPRLPLGMTVDACVAAMWRITPRVHLERLRFRCESVAFIGPAEGGGAPGEGLDAFTWQVGELVVSVGTEDGESLRARAEHADGMASRLRDELHIGTVQCRPDGLEVPLSGVEPRDQIEVHFIVACARGPIESGHTATWFAVDQPHSAVRNRLAGNTHRG